MVKQHESFGFGKKATKRNTHSDRGSAKVQVKKGGAGCCNWGRAGDEVIEDPLSRDDPAYDSCDELFEKAFGRPKGGHVDFDWAAMDSMSDSDNDQMDEIEAQMKSEWMKKVESEFQGCEDDAEEFFNKAQ